MKRHTGLAIAIAGLSSASIWALSQYVTGHREAWDADGFYYIASLVLGGLVSGLFAPKPLWAHYVGAVLGQVSFMLLFLRLGPLFVIGFGFLLAYSVLFLGGAIVGARIRAALSDPAPE